MIRALAILLVLLGIAACDSGQQSREPVSPALWQVTGPDGERGWLFATIHALPAPVRWRSDRVDAALADADLLVVEASEIVEPGAVAAIFAELAHDGPEPPLSLRVPEDKRAALRAALDKADMSERRFAAIETWAAALTLAQALTQSGDPANGIDRALLNDSDLPRRDLEGARRQLAIFDTLPEQEQRELLELVVEDPSALPGATDLAGAWARGDMDAIAAETQRGLLADPELRDALLTRRNADWIGQIETLLRNGDRPFIAVGAAHLAGPEGLPTLLAARCWTVRRIQ